MTAVSVDGIRSKPTVSLCHHHCRYHCWNYITNLCIIPMILTQPTLTGEFDRDVPGDHDAGSHHHHRPRLRIRRHLRVQIFIIIV